MPLIKGYSEKSIGKNIAREMETKPRKQAIAIALETARQAKKRAGKWMGGRVEADVKRGYPESMGSETVAPDKQDWDLEGPDALTHRKDTTGEPHAAERKAMDFKNVGSDAPAGFSYTYHQSPDFKSPVLEHLHATDITDKYDPEDEMSIARALKKRRPGT